MDNGWIKLHRKLLENPIMINAELLQLFIYCLLRANHKDNQMIWNGAEITVATGSFITGRKQMANDLEQSEGALYKRLKTLEKLGYISLKSNNKFTLLTIEKYNTYQVAKSLEQQQSNNKVTTKEQQSNTNNNDKNVKNDKKEDIVRAKPETELFNQSCKWFIDFTKEKINPNYRFNGKEGKHLKLFLKSIADIASPEFQTPADLFKGFQCLITKAYQDDWVRDKWELSLINSQWNKLTNPKLSKQNDWNYIFS